MSNNQGVIYSIKNKVNGKKYIGQTDNFKRRKRQHTCKSHNTHAIDKAINKYGKEKFKFEIIETTDIDNLSDREKFWIKEYNTYKGEGYNCTPGGKVLRGKENPMYGVNHSEKAKKKISEKHSGRILTKEHRLNIGKANKGEKCYFYDKHFFGENNPFYGETHTKETKELLSKLKSGVNHPFYGKKRSKEFINKVSGENNFMYGKHHSKETKEKISKVLKEKGINKGINNSQAIVTKEMANNIKKDYKNNDVFYKHLKEKYNISISVISKIIRGEHWTQKEVVCNE